MSQHKTTSKLSPIWLLGVAGALLFVAVIFSRARNEQSVINYIDSSSDLNATIINSLPCNKNKFSSFTFSNPCGSGSFSTVTYTCSANGSTGILGKKPDNECYSPDDWRMQAENSCPEVCFASSSPSPSPSPSPQCYAQQISHYAYRDICTNSEQSYHYIDYRCGNETTPRTLGDSNVCQFARSLLSGAEYYCRQNPCPFPSPNPSLSPTPIPSPNHCFSLVKSLTLSSPCVIADSQGYQSIQYKCSNGTAQVIKPNSCLPVGDIHVLLQKECGVACPI